MGPLISNLFHLGYEAKSIINFLSKKIGGMENAIKGARGTGYSDEDILKFISGKMKRGNSQQAKEALTDQERYLKSIGLHTKQEKQEKKRRVLASAIGAAGTALGAYKAYSKYSKGGLKGLFGESSIDESINPSQPSSQVIQSAKQPGIHPTVPQVPTTPQQSVIVPNKASKMPQTPKMSGEKILSAMGLLDRAQSLLKSGQDAETITKSLIDLAPGPLKSGYQQSAPQILEAVMDLAQTGNIENPTQLEQIDGQNQILDQEESTNFQDQQASSPELQQQGPRKEIKPPKSKGSLVALSDGEIGTVDDVKKDHLVVGVDGKKRPVKMDDAIDIPSSEEDLADLYTNLIQAIPEKARSSMINMAGYDADHNELIFKPHEGAFYVYKDIPEEFVDKLKNVMFNAKTTGENFYGAWSQGEESRGAGLSELIKELQKLYGGKGKEYARKYQTIYDLLALPKEAVKQKLKRERDEAKRKKAK